MSHARPAGDLSYAHRAWPGFLDQAGGGPEQGPAQIAVVVRPRR
jgi:hypothetical protein